MSQSDRFIEAARELGCDESEDDFAEIVRKMAKAPAQPTKPPRDKTVVKRRSKD